MKTKIISLAIIITASLLLSGCTGCSDTSSKYDNEYWESVNRENAMRDEGLNNIADEERSQRQDRLQNGSSSSSSSTSNTYQGSQKQKDDLKAIDEYMRNNPNF